MGAMCLATGMGVGAALVARQGHAVGDSCALPGGVPFASLPEADKSAALRHALACVDYEAGRLSLAEFRARTAAPQPAVTAVAPAQPPPIMWAASVRAVSSQYRDTDYAASHALGPPDVYPAAGDLPNAWAPLAADGGIEFIEVGFAEARRMNGLEIFETFNPGAITQVELIGVDGRRWTVYQGSPARMAVAAYQRKIDFACTSVPVVAVRVTMDTRAVPGWNEIDAIGAHSCE
jgi:hypothetical protein